MGNIQSQENEEDRKSFSDNKKLKQTEKVQIVPYMEGMPILQSKLQKLIKQNGIADQRQYQNNEVIMMKEKKEQITDIQKEINYLETTCFNDISDHIRQEFENFSQENKMGQRKLLEYFGLQDLEHHKLGSRFFLTCKSTLSNDKTGPYLDYSKFLKTLSLLSGENSEGRLQFMYQLFDVNLDGKIERDEMKDTLQMVLESLLSVTYEDEELKQLSKKIQQEQERIISLALEQITQEIFDSSNESSSINFSKWKQWIESINGFKEVLSYDPQAFSSQRGAIRKLDYD